MAEQQKSPEKLTFENPSRPSISPSSDVNPPEGVWVKKPSFPNPQDAVNPDAATLREQWRYATRQYSRWYSQSWGTAILAGVTFFAIGWLIKGSNPLPSRTHHNKDHHAPRSTAVTDQPSGDGEPRK